MRSLLRHRGFAATAIATLALGIGLSTAVFTVAGTLLVRDLPVRDQERLVVLWGSLPDQAFDYPLGYAGARGFAGRTRALGSVALVSYHGAWQQAVRDGERLSRLRQALVSGEFFDVLGARAVVGRALRAADDVAGAPPVTVISHGLWQRLHGGSPDVIGREIVVHGTGVPHTIVGVMPQGLEYPAGTDFWVPIVPARVRPGTDSVFADVFLVGRLRAGVPAPAARDELTAYFGRAEASPWERSMRGVVTPLPRLILGDVRPAVIAFAAASGLILLITCINVANLLLVRGLGRAREMAVRSALGAGRWRVAGLLLAENAILALAGGVLGVAVAAGAVEAFVAVAPATLPRLSEIRLDAQSLGIAFGVTASAMLLFGLAPAAATSRVELHDILRSGSRETGTRGSRLATEALVAGQVALAVVVLSAAALIGRSLLELQRAELAFDPSNVLIAEPAFRFDRVETPEQQRALLDRLVPAVGALPGVLAVSPVVAAPFAGPGGWDGRPGSEGQTPDEASRNPILNMEVVAPEYFAVLRLGALAGRTFTAADREGAPPVVVVSASAARHYWPGEDPIGKRLFMGGGLDRPLTVVGVVPDTRYRELRTARPSIYFPLRQSFFPFAPLTLAIRTLGEPADLVPSLRDAIAAADPGMGLAHAAPFTAYMAGPLEQPRLNALLLGVFAGAALLLAAIGLFAVMAAMVARRTRELGVRMALGATAGDLRLMVLGRGLAIAAAGTALGIAGALGANQMLGAMLHGVTPTDAGTMAGVAGLLIAVAAIAAAIPARSTTRIDPARVLRIET